LDAGTAANLPTGVTKTLPTALCPPSMQPAEWIKFRPDIALVHPTVLDEGPSASRAYPIHLVEVGYCSDTNHSVKYAQKQAQHAQLLNVLRTQGYRVDLTVVTLGTTGTIPTTTFQNLERLGMDFSSVTTLLHKLHLLTVKHLGHIVYERRRRETSIDPG